MATTFDIRKCSNPQWGDAGKTSVNVDLYVTLDDDKQETWRFCATPTDVEAHGKDIYNCAINGDYGSIAAYVAPPSPPPPAKTADQIRLDKLEAALAKAGIKIE